MEFDKFAKDDKATSQGLSAADVIGPGGSSLTGFEEKELQQSLFFKDPNKGVDILAEDHFTFAKEAEHRLASFDLNKDGSVNRAELEVAMQDPHRSNRDKLIANVLDTNYFQFAGMNNFSSANKEYAISQPTLQFYKQANAPEYLKAGQDESNRLRNIDAFTEEVAKNFDVFDKDKNGKITETELQRADNERGLNWQQHVLTGKLRFDRMGLFLSSMHDANMDHSGFTRDDLSTFSEFVKGGIGIQRRLSIANTSLMVGPSLNPFAPLNYLQNMHQYEWIKNQVADRFDQP